MWRKIIMALGFMDVNIKNVKYLNKYEQTNVFEGTTIHNTNTLIIYSLLFNYKIWNVSYYMNT